MQSISNSVSDTIGNLRPWLQKVTTQAKTSDSKYFSTTNKGEIRDLKNELNSDNKQKKKEAVKKVIASMTVGKDVSSLIADVINCIQTDNLELKKLVYLYLMNYAKSQPDNAIMAVNTFVRDCDDPNPLIRALAVRTMGCIRVDRIIAYLCDPLRKTLRDEDPYVRKTAAVCVAKLYDLDPHMVEDGGFLELLRDLLSDSNPMVVANAVAAITEIRESARDDSPALEVLALNQAVVNKLLTALNECTEWGQIFILDALAGFNPSDERDAQSICERVTSRLSHANAAVVLSAVRVCMRLLELLEAQGEFSASLLRKLAPPLVTLLSAEPEIQYVALRNINLVVQKRPDILKQEMKVFFVKYNDPIYVKLEKLDIMIRLTNQANIAQVLAELKEYAKEVDVDFVRKSVRAIGRCAIKVEAAAERCVSTLLDLIQTKVNYVVQEAVVVIKDIFRKYPNKYESIIATLCENLDTLDEPEARASMIWIVGEYAERIDNADELLASFLEGFADENSQVQLQLLTAVVKLFLKRPADTQELVQSVLSLSTQDSDNPDLRDRGYIYWRLLSTDPAAAKEVVLAEKPLISEETDLLEPTLLDELVCHIGSLASVYHKPPNAFVEGRHIARRQLLARSGGAANQSVHNTIGFGGGLSDEVGPAAMTVIPTQGSLIDDLLDLDPISLGGSGAGGGGGAVGDYGYSSHSPLGDSLTAGGSAGMDLLNDSGGLDSLLSLPGQTFQSGGPGPSGTSTDQLADIFGDLGLLGGQSTSTVAPPPSTAGVRHETWLTASKAKGLEICGGFLRSGGQITMDLVLTNRALQPMTDFAMQFDKNSFKLAPAQPMHVPLPLLPNQSQPVQLLVGLQGGLQKMDPLTSLRVAVKNNIGVFYFACVVPMQVLFTEDGEIEKRVFLATWKEIPAENESQALLDEVVGLGAEVAEARLRGCNVFTIAKRNVDGQDMLYQSLKMTNGIVVLAELKIQPAAGVVLSLKSRSVDVYPGVTEAFKAVLGAAPSF